MATRTDLIAVSGRIDRLDDRRPGAGPGELVVVDYKTGRRPLTVDDARTSLALALYAVAAARVLRRPCQRVELHHLPTATVLAWEHTPASLARHVSRAEDIAAECADADQRYKEAAAGVRPAEEVFRPRPGPACGWCDFRAHCPEGMAAAPQRRPWDGLNLAAGDGSVAPGAAVPATGVSAVGVSATGVSAAGVPAATTSVSGGDAG